MVSKTVAVVNSNEDIIDGIRLILSEEGFNTVSGHVVSFKRGKDDIVAFLKKNNPDVVMYDMAPPYEENWTYLQTIKNLKESKGRRFVVTTTNKNALKNLTGAKAMELLGKPYDIKEVIKKIKKAASSK